MTGRAHDRAGHQRTALCYVMLNGLFRARRRRLEPTNGPTGRATPSPSPHPRGQRRPRSMMQLADRRAATVGCRRLAVRGPLPYTRLGISTAAAYLDAQTTTRKPPVPVAREDWRDGNCTHARRRWRGAAGSGGDTSRCMTVSCSAATRTGYECHAARLLPPLFHAHQSRVSASSKTALPRARQSPCNGWRGKAMPPVSLAP